jgi:chromosome segregation ATPase
MFDQIHAFFQFLEGRFGLHPVAIIVFAVVLVLPHILFALYLFLKLKRAREIIAQLAERLGYEPPFGDGEEVVNEESHKQSVERDYDQQIDQLKRRTAELEAEAQRKGAELATNQRRAKELEDQLRRASLQNEKATSDAGEEAEAHQAAIRNLEDQLRQSALQNQKTMALANDQAQAHRNATEQFEQRLRDMETQGNADLTALQRRSKELEKQLEQATLHSEQMTAQIADQAQAHHLAVQQLEQRIHDLEAGSNANLTTLQQRTKELEDQLHQAYILNDDAKAQIADQAQAHQLAVQQLEQRIHDLEAGSNANLTTLQQRTKELEDQLHQSYVLNDDVKAQIADQTQAHQLAVQRFEQRIHDLEAEKDASNSRLKTVEAHATELEGQLQQAAARTAPEETPIANAKSARPEIPADISGQLLRRAEWITARAVGSILLHGLVAAEAYASAAPPIRRAPTPGNCSPNCREFAVLIRKGCHP